jgi:hypothetical protein
MANKKKQHYVPKFYLRYFSLNDSTKIIKLCLKDTGRIIHKANLEGQAQEDYFYGKDLEREEWFGTIENQSSLILNRVVQTKELPKDKSDNYYLIWLFILLQAYRTKSNVEDFNHMIDTIMKTAMKLEPQFKNFDYDTHFFAYEDAIEKKLDLLLNSLPMMMDMQIKLIRNTTSNELITSDNPISKYNQFLESRKFPFGHNGMASKGLQIFYPLAPDLLLIMYDPKVYKIGNKKQFSNIPMNEKDIEYLNILTCLYANKSIYSTDNVTDFQLEQWVKESNIYKEQKKLEVKHFDPIQSEDDAESVIVQHHQTPYMIKLPLSFVKQTQHAKSYKMSGYYAEFRDERIRNREQ